ncbi:MAG: Rieske (2Fe-2S) protein, partial [Ralstonia sp.]
AHLSKLEVAERDGEVWWQPDALFRMPVLLSPVPPTAS